MEESKKWVKTKDVENCTRQEVESKGKGKKGCRKPNVSHYVKRNYILSNELKASHLLARICRFQHKSP